MKIFTLLVACGILAGVINGFLGSGGGIILIFIMTFLAEKSFFPLGLRNDPKSFFATAVASILPMSVISAVFYFLRGDLSLEGSSVFLLPAAVGGVFGSFMLEKLSTKLLKAIFAVLMIWAGVRMITT